MSNNGNGTALAVLAVPAETQALISRLSRDLHVLPHEGARIIARYGEDVVCQALEVRHDKLTVSFGWFFRLVETGMMPEEVKAVYLTKANIFDYAIEHHSRCSVSLIQLARLAQRFYDFRTSDEDGQYELVSEILRIFGWDTSFKAAVTKIIACADELGFDSLDQLIVATNEFSDGSVFTDYALEEMTG